MRRLPRSPSPRRLLKKLNQHAFIVVDKCEPVAVAVRNIAGFGNNFDAASPQIGDGSLQIIDRDCQMIDAAYLHVARRAHPFWRHRGRALCLEQFDPKTFVTDEHRPHAGKSVCVKRFEAEMTRVPGGARLQIADNDSNVMQVRKAIGHGKLLPSGQGAIDYLRGTSAAKIGGLINLIIWKYPNTLFAMSNNHARTRLDDLSIFLAVVDARGFRAAAKRLGLSASSVSEKISQLEAELGVPLLTRTTRSVSPTDAGRELADRISPLLKEVGLALDDTVGSHGEVRGTLKLNVPGAVMVDILPELIADFMALHPQIRVDLVMENRLVDIVAAGCDAGIRYGEHLAQDMIAVPIGPPSQCLALAASPAYLEQKPLPSEPAQLLDHDCIRMRFSSGLLVPWELQRGDDIVTVDPPARLLVDVDAVQAAIGLSRSGRGIIATFGNWLQPHFESGALVPVLEDWWQWFDGPRLYFYSRFMPTPLRAFLDFLADRQSTRGSLA